MRREKVIGWGLLAVALLISALATRDAGQRLGQTNPGFGVMDNLLVAVGSLDLGPLQPFDLVRAVNGQLVTSGRELQAEVRRHPPGTALHYLVNRRGQVVEVDVPSQRLTVRHWHQYLSEGLLPSLLFLALGAIVLYLKPGAPETRLFLAFCLSWFAIEGLYTASGPVTNLAARLAALGEGDVIFIGAETRARLEEGWMVEDLGEPVLRNVEEPVRVFQLAVTLEVPAPPSLLARS